MNLNEVPAIHHPVMEQLEKARKTSKSGTDFWLAREIMPVLGYKEWSRFSKVIEKAKDASDATSANHKNHFSPTAKMVSIGSDSKRKVDDFFLSRGACYLIAMNGNSKIPQIGTAMLYFASQTRRMELLDQEIKDHKRIDSREKVTRAAKRVQGVAKDYGVKRFDKLHGGRWLGMYGMSMNDVKASKGLAEKDHLFNYAGPLELSAHEFQMNLASEKIEQKGIKSESSVIATNIDVAKGVRKTMIAHVGHGPEQLTLESEPIKEVQKRLKNKRITPKEVSSPTASPPPF